MVIVKYLPPNKRRYLYGGNESSGLDSNLHFRRGCISLFIHVREGINRNLLSFLWLRSVLPNEFGETPMFPL
jgi:hypothetical protein